MSIFVSTVIIGVGKPDKMGLIYIFVNGKVDNQQEIFSTKERLNLRWKGESVAVYGKIFRWYNVKQ